MIVYQINSWDLKIPIIHKNGLFWQTFSSKLLQKEIIRVCQILRNSVTTQTF